jgi:membrane protease YdiL (CAAX protease family)
VLIPLVAMQLLDTGMTGLEIPELTRRLLIETLFAGYVAFLLTLLAWWRKAGFRRPEVARRSLATLPLFLLPLLVLAGSGVKPAAGDRVIGFVLFTLLVGFAEEGLLRGVVLRALLQTGPSRAVMVSSLIFGLGHLANLLTGASVSVTTVQVVEDVFLGIAFAGAFLYAGTIWPVVVLHMSLDLVDVAGRGFAFPPPQPTSAPVVLPIVLTGLCALYGWWLLRRVIKDSMAAPAG